MRYEHEMSSNSKAPGHIAGSYIDNMNSGAVPAARPQHAENEPSPKAVTAINNIARGVADSLKHGGVLKGTIRSLATASGVEVATVTVVLPMLGERQILVRNEGHLRIGQEVAVECVQNAASAKRYTFRMANGAPVPLAAKSGSPSWQ